jgi:hypothetical protein
VTKRTAGLWLAVALCWGVCSPAWAARVIPNRFDLAQSPGTTAIYTMILEGDQASTEELRLYLGDWERTSAGDHDWGIPVNGARWTSDQAFAAGDVLEIRYRVEGDAALSVAGSFRTGTPQMSGSVDGVTRLDGAESATATLGASVAVSRSIDAGEVTLRVECRAAFDGLTITETYSGSARLSVVDAAGGTFDSIDRSCSSWISLSDSGIQLEPGEQREIDFAITTPSTYEGSYWSALFVESQPQIIEQGGTRVLSIPRTAIKVFVTAPGTETVAAAITSVSVLAAAPLAVSGRVENRGNVELALSGALEIIDRSGTIVRQLAVEEFKVLPGAARVLSIVETADAAALPVGIYQATLRLEYGGEGPIVGVRGFRVS